MHDRHAKQGEEIMDSLEFALGFAAAACILDDIEEERQKQERAESLRNDLASSGLDETDLFFMDDDERTGALERAGLDPYDYDDFDW